MEKTKARRGGGRKTWLGKNEWLSCSNNNFIIFYTTKVN